jgi:hypothetical protein
MGTRWITLLIFGLTVAGCGKESASATESAVDTPQAPTAATETSNPSAAKPTAARVYGIERGVIEYEVTNAGLSGVETTYFADYGLREATYRETNIATAGGKALTSRSALFYDGLRQIDVDLDKKSGTQTDIRSRKSTEIDIDALIADKGDDGAKKYLEKFKIELLEPVEVVGYECQVVRIRQRHTNYTHKGIVLKTEMTSPKGKVLHSRVAMKFEPDAKFDDAKLSPPADIALSEPKTEDERVKEAREAMKNLGRNK